MNPYTPKISAYNLDGNVVRVKMQDVGDGSVVSSMSTDYPMSVFSTVKTGARLDNVEINRFNWNNPEFVEISGEMTSLRPVMLPLSSMRRYFLHTLDKAFEDNGITFKATQYASKLVPANAVLEQEITSSVKPAFSKILHNSNNLYSETLFKVAGACKYNSTGTETLALAAMEDFYKKLHVNFKDVVVKDGSGVSRNNLVTTEWMTEVLEKIYKQKDFEKFMAIQAIDKMENIELDAINNYRINCGHAKVSKRELEKEQQALMDELGIIKNHEGIYIHV